MPSKAIRTTLILKVEYTDGTTVDPKEVKRLGQRILPAVGPAAEASLQGELGGTGSTVNCFYDMDENGNWVLICV